MSPRKARDVRPALIEAAVRLLDERGIDRVNSNHIARAAGVGVGTFYAHYRDKYELIRHLRLEVLEGLGARLEEASRAPGRDRSAPVRAQVEAMLAFAEEDAARFRVALATEVGSGAGGVGLSSRRLERRLRGLEVQGRLAPGVDATVAARAAQSMLVATILWWLGDPTRAPREAVVETLVQLHPILSASLAPRTPRPRPSRGMAPSSPGA